MWVIKPSFVTFIIPSMARPSLDKALQSVVDQTDWNWHTIVVFDGVEIPINIKYLEDNHFTFLTLSKQGHAGLVRNHVLHRVATEWIAFLDDDDFLAPTYVQKLKEYSSKNPDTDIIIFSYKDVENGNLQPPRNLNVIKECNVGISFAIKRSFVNKHGISFKEGGIEDYRFLKDCVDAGAKYLITHDIQYFVGHRSGWK